MYFDLSFFNVLSLATMLHTTPKFIPQLGTFRVVLKFKNFPELHKSGNSYKARFSFKQLFTLTLIMVAHRSA